MLHYLVMLPHYNESKMLPCPLATPEVPVDYCNAAHPANNVSPSYPPLLYRRTIEAEGNVAVIIKIGCSH